ncbi:glycosyltransferase family 2 protein [Aquimarina sp. U1-2]|uniref:glycosyltransferase family 2 protein n=1 Tax=Aquimarina sp. U1-2 TaxID=2823141 RepID=UPI001AEC7954|nr:glycosyltransferase family 2 protein [Aquimarina sp. U1-2]MBP2833880.1 glycosyltransferase family 2 protein [Aquimarina sp. U1-2]
MNLDNEEDNFKSINKINSISIRKHKLKGTPKFTIAIPTYKRVPLLQEAINSALNQEYNKDFEIIVVDNDPTRNCSTENLVVSYQDYRLSYFKNEENLGMTGNWNRLFNLASGDYVVMLHDDDLLYPNFLTYLDKVISNLKVPYDAIFTPHTVINGDSNSSFPERKKYFISYDQRLKTKDFLWGNIVGPPVGMCLKKDVVLEVGGFSQKNYPSIDYDFYVKLSEKHKCSIIGGHPISMYRIGFNESQDSRTLLNFISNDQKIKSRILSSQKVLNTKIWNKYSSTNSFFYLKKMRKLFGNNELTIDSELKKLRKGFNSFNYALFLSMNIYKKISFILKRKYFRV